MVAEMVAIISLGTTTLGSLWKLYHHIDQRLDLLQVDRETLRAEVKMLEFRLDRLERSVLGEIVR